MNFPPPGYDDESVVPRHRLKFLLSQFQNELSKIETVFHQYLPDRFHTPHTSIEQELGMLRASAEELGSDYPFLVERLISDYEHFRDEPTEEKLEQLFSDVKSLQLLLVG
ncbi:MAG: hypothetical protein JJU12_02400 [Chlamydiales bacterium]|nr:hypothetical protein [Chlamydiales bacterium]